MSKQRQPIVGFVGPMNARKTLMLLDYIFAAEAVGENVLVYKPKIDDRFSVDQIRSRCGGSHAAIPVPSSTQGDLKACSSFILEDIAKNSKNPSLVAIDEVMMFDDDVAELALRLSEAGIQVVYSGLNSDYRGEPFSQGIAKLMPISTRLEVLTARCTHSLDGIHKCGSVATMTQRLKNGQPDSYDSPLIVIEKFATAEEKPAYTYEARCLDHWSVAGTRPKVDFKFPLLAK